MIEVFLSTISSCINSITVLRINPEIVAKKMSKRYLLLCPEANRALYMSNPRGIKKNILAMASTFFVIK